MRPKAKGGGVDGKMTAEVPRHYTLPAVITTGVAVAGLGLGIGFGLAARSQYTECDTEPLAPVGCDEKHDSIRRRALIADVGFGLAIGGAVATIVLIATSGKESRLIVEPTAQGVASIRAGEVLMSSDSAHQEAERQGSRRRAPGHPLPDRGEARRGRDGRGLPRAPREGRAGVRRQGAPPAPARGSKIAMRFDREAELAGRLRHPT